MRSTRSRKPVMDCHEIEMVSRLFIDFFINGKIVVLKMQGLNLKLHLWFCGFSAEYLDISSTWDGASDCPLWESFHENLTCLYAGKKLRKTPNG